MLKVGLLTLQRQAVLLDQADEKLVGQPCEQNGRAAVPSA
jgi:hypothetical protein